MPMAVVARCSDHARDPGAVAEVVRRVGVVADDVPAREHLRQVGERREARIDDGDHDLRVAGRQLPEIGGAGEPLPPLVAPDRIVRVGHVAGARGRRSERRQGCDQAEDSQGKDAPHARQCTGALRPSKDQTSASRRGSCPASPGSGPGTPGNGAPARVFPWKTYPFATLFPAPAEFIKVGGARVDLRRGRAEDERGWPQETLRLK